METGSPKISLIRPPAPGHERALAGLCIFGPQVCEIMEAKKSSWYAAFEANLISVDKNIIINQKMLETSSMHPGPD